MNRWSSKPKVYIVLVSVVIFCVILLSDAPKGSANVSISFLGYTNSGRGREALLSLKNDSFYDLLRNESCTIASLEGEGQRRQEFYHLTPALKKIEPGSSEIVKVPIQETIKTWNVSFSFNFAPEIMDVFSHRLRVTSKETADSVFVRLSPTVTNDFKSEPGKNP
jgi:hypothetical protein